MHQELIKLYYDWHKERFDFAPKIDGSDGKAVKQLITYLKGLSPDVLETFQYILTHWEELDEFYQKQTRLRQINSNIHNIIHHFKNGKSTKNTAGVTEEYLRRIAEGLAQGNNE